MRHPSLTLLLALTALSGVVRAHAEPSSAATPAAPPAQSVPAGTSEPAAKPSLESQVAELRTELQALRTERASEQQAEVHSSSDEEQKLKLYGFLDFGFKKAWGASDPFFNSLTSQHATFVLGDINLYLDAQPIQDWRALVETRFTTYPQGETTVDSTGNFVRTDNTVYDIDSPSGRNKVTWGGVVIERAQIEHTMFDWFNVRAGYFLTPYGIWNVDHGAPTLISLVLPNFQVEESIPARQLGVQIYGNAFAGAWDLGYTAYVSNGRAPYLLDETDNKAFGGRLTGSSSNASGERRVQFGLSGYTGDSQEVSRTLEIVSPTQLGVNTHDKYYYKEWALGGDVSLDAGGFRLRSEGLVHRVKYGDGLHEPVAFGPPGALQEFRPNRYEYFWYAICAYRYGMIEPYTYTELKYMTPRDGAADLVYQPSLGLNLYFTPYSQLKGQYAAPKFYDKHPDPGEPSPSRQNFRVIDLRYVMAF